MLTDTLFELHNMQKYSSKYPALIYSDEKYENIFYRIIYLITLGSNISDIYSYKYTTV